MRAEQAYAALLDADPQHTEALAFVARCRLLRGAYAPAGALLQRLCELTPDDAHVWQALGEAALGAGDLTLASSALQRTLKLDLRLYLARLMLGRACELAGDEAAAIRHYFGAVFQAQVNGQWLSAETTPEYWQPLVRHAMQLASAGRRAYLQAVQDHAAATCGRGEVAFCQAVLESFLSNNQRLDPGERRVAKFLYAPGIAAQRYLPREAFPWMPQLEARTAEIAAEFEAVRQADGSLQPFIQHDSPEQLREFLGGAAGAARWDAYFFYRHGERYDAHCQRCPTTATLLDELVPLMRVPGNAPEACFSVLTAGSHILPHTGSTNLRSVVHLPLVVPSDCRLKVDGEEREWIRGQCLAFDDTFEHEAWNRSGELRAILLMDVWNPQVPVAARPVLSALIGAIMQFNAEAGL